MDTIAFDIPGAGVQTITVPTDLPTITDPVTIVHEVLHLFGASDKYGVPLRSFAPGSVTNRDVMRLDETSLLRVQIDPLTAREIGWLAGE